MARFIWFETEFVNNLLYRRFPDLEIHRSIPCDVCLQKPAHLLIGFLTTTSPVEPGRSALVASSFAPR